MNKKSFKQIGIAQLCNGKPIHHLYGENEITGKQEYLGSTNSPWVASTAQRSLSRPRFRVISVQKPLTKIKQVKLIKL